MKWISKVVAFNFVFWVFVFLSVVLLWYLTQGSSIPGKGANNPNYVLIGVAALAALLLAVIVVTPFWVIFKKAGFHPLLSLLVLMPLVNLITLYLVAFSRWKTITAQQS